MYNDEFVTEALRAAGRYPADPAPGGLTLRVENGALQLSGNPWELSDLADLLVSLARSGENRGQHWHVDGLTLMAPQSEIGELVLLRNDVS